MDLVEKVGGGVQSVNGGDYCCVGRVLEGLGLFFEGSPTENEIPSEIGVKKETKGETASPPKRTRRRACATRTPTPTGWCAVRSTSAGRQRHCSDERQSGSEARPAERVRPMECREDLRRTQAWRSRQDSHTDTRPCPYTYIHMSVEQSINRLPLRRLVPANTIHQHLLLKLRPTHSVHTIGSTDCRTA